MNLTKKLEIMEKRNALLEEENKRLREQILQPQSLAEKYKELEKVKKAWEKEIADIRVLREKYTEMMEQLKRMRKIMDRGE